MKEIKKLFCNRKAMLFLTVLDVIQAILVVYLAYLLIPLINEGIQKGVYKYNLFLYAVFFTLNLIIQIIKKKICFFNEKKVERNVLDEYSKWILNSYVDQIEYESSKYLADINNEWIQVKEALLNSLDSVISYPILFVVCFIFLIKMDVFVCIIMYLLIVTTTVFTFKKRTDISCFQEKMNKSREELLAFQKECIESKEIIDFYSLQDRMNQRHSCLTDKVYLDECSCYKKMVISYFPALINEYLPMIIFTLIALYLLANKFIEYGELFAMLQIISMLSLPMTKFVKNSVNCKNASRILAKLERQDIMEYFENENKCAILNLSFNHCDFSYNSNDEIVIKDFTLKINDGDKIAIVGESGNGKSTLLKLIGGFFKFTSGEYKVNDSFYVNDENRSQITQNISYVDDELYLLPGGLELNITCGNYDEDKYNNVLATFNVGEKLNQKNIEQNGKNFSGGEKLKINLARASYKECNLHLFDEPTAHLDQQMKQIFYEYLENLEGISIVVTHDSRYIELCNRILYVHNGLVEEIGDKFYREEFCEEE